MHRSEHLGAYPNASAIVVCRGMAVQVREGIECIPGGK
jgi:hypothetical protein